MEGKKNILFGVLNWGLGHATRSIPVINNLLKLGYSPIIASDGVALDYLKKEFPDLIFEELPSYRIRYKFENLLLQSLYLAPKISSAIRKEQKDLQILVKKHRAIAVISDNRLGFYCKEIPSAYISHQNKIIAGFPFSTANWIHHYFIKKFNQFWIPDFEKQPGLSGKLGHSKKRHPKTKYIGPLSRFSKYAFSPKQKVYDVLVLLSGPEPQRSLLEKMLFDQLKHWQGKFLIIRGKEGGLPEKNENIEIKNLVLSHELPDLILKSKMVISRSGYSSLMDYYFLKNQALLIPTPGQTEQVYLAEKCKSEGSFYSVNQDKLDLKNDLVKAKEYSGFQEGNEAKKDFLPSVLLDFLQSEGKS